MTDIDKGYILIPRTQQVLTPPNDTGIGKFVSNGLFTGDIKATITVLSDTHIGSGSHMNVGGDLVWGNVVDMNGYPIIPASSIKGYLRNMVATIAGDSTQTRPVDLFANSIFGQMSRRSKVSIGETINESKTVTTFTTVPRRYKSQDFGEDERRFYPLRNRVYSDDSGESVPIAIISPRTELGWRMTFQNLNDTQLGAILIALGYNNPDFAFNIGGAKAYGCGIIRTSNIKVSIRDTSFAKSDLDSSLLTKITSSVTDQLNTTDTLREIYAIFNWTDLSKEI